MALWLIAFIAFGAAGTWMARRYAVAHALLDQPGERRSHSVATPRGGGIAIAAAVLVAVLIASSSGWLAPGLAIAFGAGVASIAVVGLLDDHRPLSPWLRLVVHVLAAAGLALAWLNAGGDAAMAAVVFLGCIGLTNAWNFMDGINGIAAGQAALVAFAIGGAVATEGWSLVAYALAAACLGFLPFNFPRARIFLGDVGSGAIGFAIAALAVLVLGHEAHAFWLLTPMVLSAFVLDAGLTLIRRVMRGERWWTPHTQHAYQACARRWGHTRVTVSYCAWTGAAILISRWIGGWPVELTGLVIGAWYISGALLWLWLQHSFSDGSGMGPMKKQGGG